MTSRSITQLFAIHSHNPSFHSVKESHCFPGGDVTDFCVPVNLHFPPVQLVSLIQENLAEILRYYPDYSEAHQALLASMLDLPAEWIVPANGSTEIITELCQQARGPMVTCVPTFGRWTDLPRQLHIPLHTIERRRHDQFRLTPEQIVDEVRRVGASTLVLSNPNNPTGAAMPLSDVRLILDLLQDISTVVLDESFLDFSGLESAAPLAARYPNLVVAKSMGKSLGWHGVRLGYAVTAPERAARLRSRLPFWNINGLAAFVLKQLPRFQAELRESFTMVTDDRAYMTRRLAEIEQLEVFPSSANFVFVELPANCSGRALRDRLLTRHGLLVRENSNKTGSSERYLRLAVQRRDAVDSLIAALQKELRERPSAPHHAANAARPLPTGFASSHAGEILQGALRSGSHTRRVLLSLPAPVLWTKATLAATPGHAFSIEPAWAEKARNAALRLFADLGVDPPELQVRLHTNIPVAKGCGSSTADILATIRALTAYFNCAMEEEETARLIVSVEHAADGSVLSRPSLFRHREGVVEDYLAGPFPPMRVLVMDAQPASTVDTDSLPRARYSTAELATFSLLAASLKRAFEKGDPAAVGRVATASARISQRFLPKPHFHQFVDLVSAHQGYGVSVSHSGTVMSALLPASAGSDVSRVVARAAEQLGMKPLTQYRIGHGRRHFNVNTRTPEGCAAERYTRCVAF